LVATAVVAAEIGSAAVIPASLLAGRTAIRAAGGLIGESFFLVEGLFTLCENESGAAIFAAKGFVWHGVSYLVLNLCR
jgi:hypothetical protein